MGKQKIDLTSQYVYLPSSVIMQQTNERKNFDVMKKKKDKKLNYIQGKGQFIAGTYTHRMSMKKIFRIR